MLNMTSQYKKFTKLIAKWPVDSTKGERLVFYLAVNDLIS